MTSSNEPKAQHQFFTEFKPLLYGLAAFGRFPFSRDSEKRLQCRLLSVSGVYWTVVHSLTTIIAYNVLTLSVTKVISSNDSGEVLISVRNCAVLLVHFLLPLSWSSEWRMLGRYINEWDEFLVDWEHQTGKTLVTGLRWTSVLVIVLYPILLLITVTVEKDYLGHTLSGQFMHWWIVTAGFFHSSMFLLTLNTTHKISDHLKLTLSEIVVKSRNRTQVDAVEVQKLKCLWVRGSDLLVKSGNAMGQSCLLIYLVNTVWVVASLYGLIKAMSRFEFQKAIHDLFFFLACLLYVILGCELGHRASKKMRNDIVATIALIDVSGLNEMTAKELNIFLQVVSIQPPGISCAGVTNMDRSYLTTACSHIITYLIVLVQFKTTNINTDEN